MNPALPHQLDEIITPVSPFGDEADRHAVRWAEDFGLVRTEESRRRLIKTRPGMLAARCYPSANLPNLCLLADWMTWLFILDDHNDEGTYGWDAEALERGLATILVFPGSSDVGNDENPFGAGLADMVERASVHLRPEWRSRFLHHVIDYFRAYVWQAAHRREGHPPDPVVFPQLRRDAGAIMPSFDLIEFVESETLPPSLYYCRTYQRLLITAANVVCWTNDVMTFEKEVARGDTQNLVSVLREAEKISLERAVSEVSNRTGREIEHFLETEAQLPRLFTTLQIPESLQETAYSCIAMLKSWMRGHADWGRETARYLEFERSATPPEYLDDLLTESPLRVEKVKGAP